jgi:ribosomal protein S12 methylthiotransferase accessory factor
MQRQKVNRAWYASPYTGLFADLGGPPSRPHDPQVPICAGVAPLPGPGGEPPASGGAGWDEPAAEAACVGEAIERWQAWPLPCDRIVEASYRNWPLAEPAVEPGRWVLFHAEQYALLGFPFQPFNADTVCRWVCCRDSVSGLPWWVPEEVVYLSVLPGRSAQLTPLISSGLACGRWGQPILLRGLQEVIERDAVVGAAWGRYPLAEHEGRQVFASLDPALPRRLQRPNLRYRFYRIDTPYSMHVVVVALAGEDCEGYCFSVGAACRETRAASWEKALLEAVQGYHFVRFLKGSRSNDRLECPANFAEHALYYSLHPERLQDTVLARPVRQSLHQDEEAVEPLACLRERLGPSHPVLFRQMTPPGIAMERLGWCVLRVVVPGLQPLHGHHALPFLGGPLWAPRGWKEWAGMPPHPFP